MRVDDLIKQLSARPPFEQVVVAKLSDLNPAPCTGIGSYAPNEQTSPQTVIYFE